MRLDHYSGSRVKPYPEDSPPMSQIELAAGSEPPSPKHPLYPVIARARLLFAVAPLSLCVVAIRAGAWESPNSSFRSMPDLDPSVLTAFIAAAIFVLAFLLNGVMADFKESERLPGEIEALFTALHAQVRHGSRLKNFNPLPALRAIHRILLALARFLDATLTYSAALDELSKGEDALMFELDSRGALGYTGPNMLSLRSKMSRIHIIRETSFLSVAYMLADGLVALVLALLVTTKNPSRETGYVNAAVFSYLFLYLTLMIRDIDDPFGYTGKHNEGMLAAESHLEAPLWSAFFTASSIDFSTVFATFGARLHRELRAKGVTVGAFSTRGSERGLAGADTGAAGADGADKGDAGDLLRPEVFGAMAVTVEPELM